jgi:hypothetical protein
LKGKKFCKNGFKTNKKWKERVMKNFERMVIKVSGDECVKYVGKDVEDEMSDL